MLKLKLHPVADEGKLDHRAAPRRTCNSDQHWSGTVLGMSGDKDVTSPTNHNSVPVVLRLDLQDALVLQVVQKHTTLDFRLHDVVIYLIAQVSVRREELWAAQD